MNYEFETFNDLIELVYDWMTSSVEVGEDVLSKLHLEYVQDSEKRFLINNELTGDFDIDLDNFSYFHSEFLAKKLNSAYDKLWIENYVCYGNNKEGAAKIIADVSELDYLY